MAFILPWLGLFDFATARANFIKPVDLSAVTKKENDFALLVPIFNSTKYLTNIEFLKKYSKHVVLCTTTNETEEFYQEIENLCDTCGFRTSISQVGGGKKNPWAIYNKTLLAHDAVLKNTISNLKEEYVIFIDGDTFVDGNLETLVGAMEENEFDISSVKILPTKRTNIIENLQGVEYDISMQARLIYPWLTSGAGMVAKREVMENIMKNHSLFFNGGDIEIGKLADMMGYRVGHLPMIFYTDIPETFTKWVKQRFSWMCGMFRHSIINWNHNLKHPFHFIYFTFIIYILYPLKVFSMFTHWYILPFIIAFYAVLTYVANWKVRSKWMFIFPLYALFQILVILWFGIYRYIKTVIQTKNIGRIKMTHNPNNVSLFNLNYAKNLLIIFTAIPAILLSSDGLTQRIVLGEEYEVTDMARIATNSLYNVFDQSRTDGQVAGASNEVEAQPEESISEEDDIYSPDEQDESYMVE